MLAAEARAERTLLVGIIHRRALLEHVAEGQAEPLEHFPEEDRARAAIEQSHGSDSFRQPAEGDENARGGNHPEQRERQEHLPAQTHQLVVAVARHGGDRKSTRLNSSHYCATRLPSYACKKKQQKK